MMGLGNFSKKSNQPTRNDPEWEEYLRGLKMEVLMYENIRKSFLASLKRG